MKTLLMTLLVIAVALPTMAQQAFGQSGVDDLQNARLNRLEKQMDEVHSVLGVPRPKMDDIDAYIDQTPVLETDASVAIIRNSSGDRSAAPALPRRFEQTLTSKVVSTPAATASVEWVSQPVSYQSQPINFETDTVQRSYDGPLVSRTVSRSSGCANGQCSQRSSRSGRGLFGWR